LFAKAEGGEGVTKAGVDKEEEKLPSKSVARRTSKKEASTRAPVVDKNYFTPEYKSTVLSYWTAPYNQQDVLEYLNIGDARHKRGCLYVKFVKTLYLLGNEYLSPEEFVKRWRSLYKWEFNLQMQESNYGGMGELTLSLGRLKDPKDDDWCLTDGVSLTMYLWDSPDYKKKASWNESLGLGQQVDYRQCWQWLVCCQRIPERRDCLILCQQCRLQVPEQMDSKG
jgi:hypothetical protein